MSPENDPLGGERWRVIEGDALSVLRTLPAGSVDAVVTDPPYFRVKSDEWDRQWRNESDYLAWLGAVADEWQRVLTPNGSLYCFASPKMGDQVAELIRKRFCILNRIRWLKEEGWHRKTERAALRSFLSPWEEIVFAEQASRDDWASGEAGYDEVARRLHQQVYAPIGAKVRMKRETAGLERWEVDTACAPSRKPTGLCYRWEEGACLPTLEQWIALCRLVGDEQEYEALREEYEALREEYEALRRPFTLGDRDEVSDVWSFRVVMGYDDKHPCEKPVALMSRIITTSTHADALILDSCAGSGTTGVACIQEGRRFLGVEREPRYVAIARRRIADAAAQGNLFDPLSKSGG